MSSRNLELNLRARADTSGLDKLIAVVSKLEGAMDRLAAAVDRTTSAGRGLAIVGGQMANIEARNAESSQNMAQALDRTADARERAVVMTKNAIIAEERAVLAAEKQAQAAINTSIASEKLAQAQASTEASASKAAVAEEKLSQERLKTELAARRVEKEEFNIAKARDQARIAAVKAEEAEGKLAKSRSSLGQIGTVLKGALGAAGIALSAQAIGRQLIQLGQDSLVAASRAEEGATKFKAVFKDMSSEVGRELEVMASANRRSVYDLVDYTSQLQAVFTSMGLSAGRAREMSTSIAQLGVDFGAFFNIADSHAVDNLTSALIGNHRAVKQFGIPLNVAAINMELMRMNMNGLQGEALEAAKVQARFNIIMRASADIQGAAVREAGTYANVMKAWQASVTDLKVAIGQGLEPAMSRLAEAGTNMINALLGKDAQEALGRWADDLEKASDVDDFVVAFKAIRAEIVNTGNAWESYRAGLGDIGDVEDVRPFLEAMALSAESSEEFEAAIKRAEISSDYFGIKMAGSAGVVNYTAGEFYKLVMAAEEIAQKNRDIASTSADADRSLRVLAGVPDIEIGVDVEGDPEKEITGIGKNVDDLDKLLKANELLVKAKAVVGFDGEGVKSSINRLQGDLAREEILLNAKLSVKGGSADAELKAQARELRQVWLDAFNAGPIDELVGAQQALFSGDAGGAQEARAQVEAANAAIVRSFKERAFEILSAKALEQGNTGLIASISQVAVAMGLITQEEANTRAAYATTMQQIQLLTSSQETYALSAAGMGEAVRLVAEGIVSDWAAAVEAAKQFQIDMGRNMYADWKSGIDQNSPPEYKSVIATEFGTSVSDFTDIKSVMEEYDNATYKTDIRADLGTTKTDIDDIQTKLQSLVAEPWVVQIQTRQSGGVSGGGSGGSGGGGGGGGGDDEITRGRTFVVEGVTVNNYSGGPGVADQTRRGVLAAFRSLA